MSQDDLPKDLKRLKVDQLKDELSKRGLETTGIKKDVCLHSTLPRFPLS
jgi:hypothetical protein